MFAKMISCNYNIIGFMTSMCGYFDLQGKMSKTHNLRFSFLLCKFIIFSFIGVIIVVSSKVEVKCKEGIHARPASQIVQFVKGFSSDLKMHYEGKSANCKSIINLLALGAKFGVEVEITAEGPDENEELKTFVEFMENLSN